MPRGKRISAEKKAEIARLHDKGVPLKEIAQRVGVGYSSVYELTARRVPRYAEPKFKQFEKPLLEIGRWYTFRERVSEGSGKKCITRQRRMKLVEVYPHHALFVSEKGIRRCYQWWDIIYNAV